MSSERRKKYKLGEIIEDIAMGPFGSNIKVDNFIDRGVPVIRGANLNEGGFDEKSFVFVSEEKAQSLKRSLAYPDDLVFTHRGTIGQVGIIPYNKFPKYLVSQSQLRLTVNKNFIEPRFLYYFFRSSVGQYELLKNASQVGVPAIAQPTQSLKDVDIQIPDLETQKEIVNLLSTLDDKIVLNRETNSTLEAIAQAIFKEWFVDFNYPGATGELVDSPLGPIPKGWIITPLSNVYSLEYGKGLPSTDRNPGSVPVYGSNGLIGYHDIPLVRGPGVVIGRKGSVGTVNWVNQDFFPIDTAFFVKLQLGGAITQFHYYQLKHVGFASYSTDTAVPGLNRIEAGRAKLITPEQNQLYLFNSIASPLFSFIHQNEIENQSLIRVRDTLINQIFCKDYLESER